MYIQLSGLTNIKDEEGLHYEFSGLLLLSEASLDQVMILFDMMFYLCRFHLFISSSIAQIIQYH